MKRLMAFLLAAVLAFTGCAAQDGGPDPTEPTKNHVEIDYVVSTGEGAKEFALNLFRQTAQEGENTLVSPLSVLTALAMTANGAGGDTLAQMEWVLGSSREELNRWLEDFADTEQLKQANGIWIKEDGKFTPETAFLDILQKQYNARMETAPFDDATRDQINGWVKEQTDGMIDGIVDKIPPEAIMYLVNALAFEAQWEDVYEEHQVQNGIFTTEDGRELDVEMMYGTANDYLRTEKSTGFIRWYEGREYGFVALLPNEGVSVKALADSLTGAELENLLENPEKDVVQTAIPKFESDGEFELSEVLAEMGLDLAFNGDAANFSSLGTYEGRNICISRVLHKTHMEVGEQGTRAGAATSVEIAYATGAYGPAEEPTTVYLDRPFLYMIVDGKTNTPIFMGTCMEILP